MGGVVFEDVVEGGEEEVEGAEEFGAVFVSDGVQVADNPAGGFKFPFAGQPEEAVIRGNVGEEGKSSATEGTKIALTTVGAEAGEKNHARGEVRVVDGAVRFG